MLRPFLAVLSLALALCWSANASAGTCAFSAKEGKYLKCTSFSKGVCKAGSTPCKPGGGKCAFSAKKGKYVKCTSFSKGTCQGGSSPCKPKR